MGGAFGTVIAMTKAVAVAVSRTGDRSVKYPRALLAGWDFVEPQRTII
jgi:hypothetical protein